MLLLAVCDDIPIECVSISKQVESVLKQTEIEFSIKNFFDGKKLISCVENFDIIFLDIKMPEINGMDLARSLREQGRESIIIFITSAKEYVFEAYDVEAFQYLVKPIQIDKLKNVIEKAVRKIQGNSSEKFLVITSGRQTKKILLNDIIYVESVGRIAKIHCVNGVMETYEKISDLENKLSEHFFFRCHKGYLVNLEYVDTVGKTDIILENGESIILAKRRCDDFKKALLLYVKWKGGII